MIDNCLYRLRLYTALLPCGCCVQIWFWDFGNPVLGWRSLTLRRRAFGLALRRRAFGVKVRQEGPANDGGEVTLPPSQVPDDLD